MMERIKKFFDEVNVEAIMCCGFLILLGVVLLGFMILAIVKTFMGI